jgi:hypothetical protein
MKTRTTAWTVGAVLSGVMAVSAQDVLKAETTLMVRVQVTDYAKVSAKELATAEAQATAAYRIAGLDLIWSSAPWGASGNRVLQPIDVHVVIVPRDMAEKKCRDEGLGDGVLGIAISGATEARGRIAYIFYDRIERTAVAQQTPVARGLAHVMAHEVGHLLIGTDSHSDEGLMQPNWNPHVSRMETFTPSQMQQIRRRFTTTLE